MQLHRRLTVHVSVSPQRSVEPCIFVWVWKGLREVERGLWKRDCFLLPSAHLAATIF